MKIDVYDSSRMEWRSFTVVPYDENFKPKCNDIYHQFTPIMIFCSCGKTRRGDSCS